MVGALVEVWVLGYRCRDADTRAPGTGGAQFTNLGMRYGVAVGDTLAMWGHAHVP